MNKRNILFDFSCTIDKMGMFGIAEQYDWVYRDKLFKYWQNKEMI